MKKKKKEVKKFARKEKRTRTKKKIIKKPENKKEIRGVDKKKEPKHNIISSTFRKLKTTILRKRERVPIGISKLDSLIGGGFEYSSVNLVAGSSGSGKSIFAVQFLLEGIKRKEKVLFVTFEERKIEFYANMKKIGWDLEKLEKQGYLIFLEYSPEKVKMMLDEGGGAIESIILKYGIKRMVIDSITSFSLLFDDELSRRKANLELFDMIRKWDCTTLFTVQYDPLDILDKGINSIEFEVDSIILLYYNKLKNKRKRALEVVKMRGTKHSTDTYSFEIKNGIKLGSQLK